MKKISFRLGMSTREVRNLLVDEYGITDGAGLSILDGAGLPAYDRAEQCRKQIKKDGLMLADSKGGMKKHPLLAVERDNRALWLAALRQLNFDVVPLNPGPGRPAGR